MKRWDHSWLYQVEWSHTALSSGTCQSAAAEDEQASVNRTLKTATLPAALFNNWAENELSEVLLTPSTETRWTT